ncbi:MAG TPA: 3-phosphoshikimate 1-carboxyvinyltransferase [Streptosporangiaceae bacterium]|nr:3-phosphoshikimate 1-carboxyvinyltransferase [Streptosporangiaceae bacterium]
MKNRPGDAGRLAGDGTSDDAGHWRAPAAEGPVRARVTVPGSKSMTNRALVLAALADGPGTVTSPLDARDTLLMRHGLAALGCHIDVSEVSRWHVVPGWAGEDALVDVGNAGTVMRFLPPAATLTSVAVAFRGDPRASQRPVGAILAALRELGAVIDDGGRDAVPFTVRGGGGLAGGVVTIDASSSSQLVSGLLLAAPRYDKGVEVRHRGPRAPSAAHIDMTVRMLQAAGAEVEACAQAGTAASGRGHDTWRVHPGVLRPGDVHIEPDLSNALPFLAAALATGGAVTVAGWPAESAQPGEQILGVLTEMGARCDWQAGGLRVTGTGTVHGVTADLADCPEATPVVAALAALADSPSRLTGVAHIRQQETDRLAALATEINALGGDVTELPDGLVVRPRPLQAGGQPFATYDDHRLVMAAAVLGLAVPGIDVGNPATVGKTFPSFTGLWTAMLKGAP